MYGIFTHIHEWLIFMVNVGKYTSPMDAMGSIIFPNQFLDPQTKSVQHLKTRIATLEPIRHLNQTRKTRELANTFQHNST